ncbi:MAG TPA: hypothetical protein VH206_01410 [Xanthobacteraceae bacterium]|jgi:hypothetical protein|nr:hypothetical protein [Xanthobacteraceae bacterium]
MLVAVSQGKYSDAVAQAEPLINFGSPIAMYVKSAALQNGSAGRSDPAAARQLLGNATQLGDPTSALFYARYLEQGIGGPRDQNQATAYYLLAARSMAAGADGDLARLHLEGQRGLTALDAYQNLLSSNRSKDAVDTLSDLLKAHSTPAVCLYGWLMSKAKSEGWLANLGVNFSLRGVAAKDMDALRANQDNQATAADIDSLQLKAFWFGASRSDPWCEWGMAMLATRGSGAYPKNLVEADAFYRLAAMNSKLGSGITQVKQEVAKVEGQMMSSQKMTADELFHSAIPATMAP